ncbi:hypothetical protein C8Q78DRAFT_994914 [Trametes maxima]|nr:hypothetical protein C8Q78DRAFT_994914 [Trametes maxima]
MLQPLVDELLSLWHNSIFLANTADSKIGLFVCIAVIPLVCDIPALWKTAGFAGHSAGHFCSFCKLRKDSINSLDREAWPRHSWAEHLKVAEEWCDAKTEARRTEIFQEYGVRWSELLRLEYWDPTRFALVDAMHNLFLGELRHHCMNVWGIDVKDTEKKTGQKKLHPHSPDEQAAHLDYVVEQLYKGSSRSVTKSRKGYIVAIAQYNGVDPEGGGYNKGSICQGAPQAYQATMDTLRQDIVATHLPSWMERPPRNFGSAGHGKLKADLWRTALGHI